MHSTLRKSFKKLKKIQNVFDRSLAVSSDLKVNIAVSSSFFSWRGRKSYDIDL